MKMIFIGIIVAIVVATGLGYFLGMDPTLSWQAYSTTSTRVEDPGSNLVGPRWTGLNTEPAKESAAAMGGAKTSG